MNSSRPPAKALAIQAARANQRAVSLAAALDDAVSCAALEAERKIVAQLDADCRSSLAVHIWPLTASHAVAAGAGAGGTGAQWRGILWASRLDGSDPRRTDIATASAEAAAAELLRWAQAERIRELLRG